MTICVYVEKSQIDILQLKKIYYHKGNGDSAL